MQSSRVLLGYQVLETKEKMAVEEEEEEEHAVDIMKTNAQDNCQKTVRSWDSIAPGTESKEPLMGNRFVPPGRRAVRHNTAHEGDIVQFSAPIYVVSEEEGAIDIDIIRLGTMRGSLCVEFHTEDGSAKKGSRYHETSGVVTMLEGEHTKRIQVGVVSNSVWAATLEFKVKLRDPKQCSLGNYLHTCRVKVIDKELFPCSDFRKQIEEDDIANINSGMLFFAYCRLVFLAAAGVGRRSVLVAIVDQFKCVYLWYYLWVQVYVVDVLFDESPESVDKLLVQGDRLKTIYLLSALYILPMILIYGWDHIKTILDIEGNCLLFLQTNIFRKYLNYTDESKAEVTPSDMQTAMYFQAMKLARGYSTMLHFVFIVGRISVLMWFTWGQNPNGFRIIVMMPVVMILFVLARCYWHPELQVDPVTKQSEMIALVSETCKNYNLIADYFQRPQMNDQFTGKAREFQGASVEANVVSNNTSYFSKFLEPAFIAIYFITCAPSVLGGELSVGVFMATLQVFNEIGGSFEECYGAITTILESVEPLRSITRQLNLRTDLSRLKAVSNSRSEFTLRARDEVLVGRETVDSDQFLSDSIPLRLTNMSFAYSPGGKVILHDVNLSVDQGSIVAVVGATKSGKASLMQLLGYRRFPVSGTIFIPSHLRVLHVSSTIFIMDSSVTKNLTFGCNPEDVKQDWIEKILRVLGMEQTQRLVERELAEEEGSSVERCPSILGKSASLRLSSRGALEGPKDRDAKWYDVLNHTEKSKIHLARALITNPEVLVLQRPLSHYNAVTGRVVLQALRAHADNRGICLPPETAHRRRPRTIFFSADTPDQARCSDVIWKVYKPIGHDHHTVSEAVLSELYPSAVFRRSLFDGEH